MSSPAHMGALERRRGRDRTPGAWRCALCLLVVSVLAGCGGGGQGGRAFSVANETVDATTVTHWMTLLAPEHLLPDPPSYNRCAAHQATLELGSGSFKTELKRECARQYSQLRERALALLISGHWLIAAAADQGLSPTGSEVKDWAQEGNEPPFTGGRPADISFIAEAEQAGAKMRTRLSHSTVTQAQVADYYHRHISQYSHPEQRDTYIVEHVPTAHEAAKLRAEVVDGRKDITKLGLHELVHESHPTETVPGKRALARAIFTAKVDELTGLVLFDGQYAFLEVRHTTPAFIDPLSKVKGSINSLLAAEQQHRTLANFIASWQRKWTARTDCSHGWVVQQCRQYSGPRVAIATLALPTAP